MLYAGDPMPDRFPESAFIGCGFFSQQFLFSMEAPMTKNIGRRIASTAAAAAVFASAAGTISAASGPERALAGVPIFAPMSQVTHKFGNPSRILVGGVAPATAGAGASAGGGYPGGGGASAGGGYPGGGGGGMAGAGLLPGFPGVPTGGGGYPGGGGGYPGGGGGYPGGGGGYPGGGTDATGAALPVKQAVTLIYDRAMGGDLEFTISPDQRVVQVRETGYKGAYGTARGIKLGTTYAQVIAHYGSPENTFYAGPILNIDYKDTLHCGFQFLDQKLVGIIVATPD